MAIESAAADAFEKVGFVERPGGVYERPATSDVFDWLGMPVTSRGGVVSASLYIGLRDVRVSDALVRFVRGDGSLEHAATAATNIGSICDHPGSWTLTSEQQASTVAEDMAALYLRFGAPFLEALSVSSGRLEQFVTEHSMHRQFVLPLLLQANGESERAREYVERELDQLPPRGPFHDQYLRFAKDVFDLTPPGH